MRTYSVHLFSHVFSSLTSVTGNLPDGRIYTTGGKQYNQGWFHPPIPTPKIWFSSIPLHRNAPKATTHRGRKNILCSLQVLLPAPPPFKIMIAVLSFELLPLKTMLLKMQNWEPGRQDNFLMLSSSKPRVTCFS